MSIDSSATGNKEKSFSTFRMVCYKVTVHASKRLITALKLTHAELKKKGSAIQTIGLIAAVLHSPRMHFMRTTQKIFALADGRTGRVFHKQNKI